MVCYIDIESYGLLQFVLKKVIEKQSLPFCEMAQQLSLWVWKKSRFDDNTMIVRLFNTLTT